MVGAIGGIAFIGLPGVVIGPVTLALLNTFVKIFTGNKITEEIKEEKQSILQKLKSKLKKKEPEKQ